MEYKVSEQVRQKFDALVKDEKVQKALKFMEEDQDAVIDRQIELVREAKLHAARSRLQDLELMERDLAVIRTQKPATFHQALQLFWIYALVAGGINYGRLDDVLGPYLQRDLEDGLITEEEAYRYLKSL